MHKQNDEFPAFYFNFVCIFTDSSVENICTFCVEIEEVKAVAINLLFSGQNFDFYNFLILHLFFIRLVADCMV